MATPNLGLTIPVGGTTPGAANNTTPGTYPYIESTNLNLIDSLCYSLNNPVVSAGININADLSFNGHSITNVNNLTVTGTATLAALSLTNLSLSGTLGVTGTSTLGVVNASGLLTLSSAGTALTITNNATISGLLTLNGAGTALTITNNATVSGTATLATAAITTGNVTTLNVSGITTLTGGVAGTIKESTASTSLTLLGNAAATGTGVVLNNATTLSGAGLCLSIQNNGTAEVTVGFGGITTIGPTGANQITLTPGAAPSIIAAATTNAPLLLAGNPAATAGPSVVIDTNSVAMSGNGIVLQINNNGTSKLTIDNGGNIRPGGFILPLAAATGMQIYGNLAASGGGAVTLSNLTTMTTPGNFVAAISNGTGLGAFLVGATSAAITLNVNHIGGNVLISPTVGTFAGTAATLWGTVTGASVTGSDMSGWVSFSTGGTTSAIAANTALFTITLGSAYNSTGYTAWAQFGASGTVAGTPAASAYYAVASGSGTFIVYNTVGFTPAATTTYKFSYFTVANSGY